MSETGISILISAFALAISAITAWLTLFRRGTVRMTAPTVIFFGPDGATCEDRKAPQKVFLRTLLYATSKRGRIVESMFVRFRRGESLQTFNIWVYGDGSLARGSGIFVGENGVACNHHFTLPVDDTTYDFRQGTYLLEVYATLVGELRRLRLFSTTLEVTSDQATQLKSLENGIYFDWGPDSRRYHASVHSQPKHDVPLWSRQLEV